MTVVGGSTDHLVVDEFGNTKPGAVLEVRTLAGVTVTDLTPPTGWTGQAFPAGKARADGDGYFKFVVPDATGPVQVRTAAHTQGTQTFEAGPWLDVSGQVVPDSGVDQALAGKVATADLPTVDLSTNTSLSNTYAAKAAPPVIDTDYASLEDALTATPVGGTLEVRGTWSRALPWTVNKSCTVRFWRGASITATVASAVVLAVAADDVTLDAPRVFGTGSSTASTGTGIQAIGTVSDRITGLRIRAPKCQDFTKYGIYLEHCEDFKVERTRVDNVAYAGIMMLSCVAGAVDGGVIRNVTMPSGFVNSYGVAMTRDSAQSLAAAPRSSNITVKGMTIDGVPGWEGIDTHGGQQLTIVDNKVFDTKVGIALVPSANESAVDTYAPTGIICTGNTVDSKSSLGDRNQGIRLVGAGTVIGTATEAANAIIAHNTVIDHGSEAAIGSAAGIDALYTRGSIIAHNTIVRPGIAGIIAYHTNDSLTLAGNSVEDAWSNSYPYSAAVIVRSTNNTVTIAGTQITRGAKTATKVNDRGLDAPTATANVITDGGGNQWTKAATLPAAGTSGILKASVYAAAPVPRAAAIATPTAPGASYVQAQAASMKTAVDAIRAALTAYGITL